MGCVRLAAEAAEKSRTSYRQAAVRRTREGWLRRRRSERCRHLADGRMYGRAEEGKGETNGCKMEKRNGFIAATDATNNRATPATRPATLLIPSGQIRRKGMEGCGVWEGSFLKLDRDLQWAVDHLMYKTDRQTVRP